MQFVLSTVVGYSFPVGLAYVCLSTMYTVNFVIYCLANYLPVIFSKFKLPTLVCSIKDLHFSRTMTLISTYIHACTTCFPPDNGFTNS